MWMNWKDLNLLKQFKFPFEFEKCCGHIKLCTSPAGYTIRPSKTCSRYCNWITNESEFKFTFCFDRRTSVAKHLATYLFAISSSRFHRHICCVLFLWMCVLFSRTQVFFLYSHESFLDFVELLKRVTLNKIAEVKCDIISTSDY